jgi:hypothetical protein
MEHYHKIYKIGCAEIHYMLPSENILKKDVKVAQVIYDLWKVRKG